MSNSNNPGNKANDALNSINEMSRITANPFLYGKIQNRMSQASSGNTFSIKWAYRLVFMLFALLVVNVFAYLQFANNKKPGFTNGIESFAHDYNINTTGENI